MVERARFKHGNDEHPAVRKAIENLDALNGPDYPEYLDELREWFRQLRRTRRYDMNGHAIAFTYPEIESWANLSRLTLAPCEIGALCRMDVADRFPDEAVD